MITRAQAEALLTLAESLEACEQLDLSFWAMPDGQQQFSIEGMTTHSLKSGRWIDGMSIRLAVNALIPKQET
jgi:hypothetical protein